MSNPKELRKQLKNVVKPLLEEMLLKELEKTVTVKVLEQIKERMDFIENNANKTLEQLTKNQKDLQSFVVKALSNVKLQKD